MNTNKQNNCDCVLNQSKRFPRKNVVTGETLRSSNGTKSKLLKNSKVTQVQDEDEVLICPEPADSSKNASTQTFSTAIFSKDINEPHFRNVTRTQIPLFGPNTAARQVVLVHNPSIFEPDRDLFATYGLPRVPMSQRFGSIGNISPPSYYNRRERDKKRGAYYDGGFSFPNNEEPVTFKPSIPIQLLKELTIIPPNNEWYISVDEYVLLQDFHFIMGYVAADESCKLLITDSIVTYIENLARGEHRGRIYVMQARHVCRRLGNFGNVQVVNTEDDASAVADVIKCCKAKIDMGERVALITKIKTLEDSAKSFGIQAYSLDYIKNGTKPLSMYVFNERNKEKLYINVFNDNIRRD